MTSSFVELPRAQYAIASVAASVRGSARRRDIAIDCVAHERSAARLPAEVECTREPAQPERPQLGVVLAQCGGRLLEQLDGLGVVDRGTPGRLLEADRGTGEHLGIAERARELGCPPECLERGVGVAGPVAGVAQPQHHVDPLGRLANAELERDLEPRLGLAEGERARRRVGREQVVVDRPLDPADRGRRSVVVRQRGQRPAAVAVRPARLERLGDEQVDLRLPRRGESVDHGAPDELVGEAIGKTPARLLHEQAVPHRLVDGVEQHVARHDLGALDRVQLEVGAGHRRERQHLVRLGREARQPLVDDLADGRRRAELGGGRGSGGRRPARCRRRWRRAARARAR